MAYTINLNEARRHARLPARVYRTSPKISSSHMSAVLTVPFDFITGDELDTGLERMLLDGFNQEIEAGQTYPQELPLTGAGFRSYFLSYDIVVGIFLSAEQVDALGIDFSSMDENELVAGTPLSSTQLARVNLGDSKLATDAGQSTASDHRLGVSDWGKTYAFSYYIKPNYPGRSSHLCNAGFVVSTSARGLGLGQIAAHSFLYYGPGCGYRGSVFNLVYTSNAASIRIWERLGFRTVGVLPEAGRLKSSDGGEDEYIDAAIVHGDFRKIGYGK